MVEFKLSKDQMADLADAYALAIEEYIVEFIIDTHPCPIPREEIVKALLNDSTFFKVIQNLISDHVDNDLGDVIYQSVSWLKNDSICKTHKTMIAKARKKVAAQKKAEQTRIAKLDKKTEQAIAHLNKKGYTVSFSD